MPYEISHRDYITICIVSRTRPKLVAAFRLNDMGTVITELFDWLETVNPGVLAQLEKAMTAMGARGASYAASATERWTSLADKASQLSEELAVMMSQHVWDLAAKAAGTDKIRISGAPTFDEIAALVGEWKPDTTPDNILNRLPHDSISASVVHQLMREQKVRVAANDSVRGLQFALEQPDVLTYINNKFKNGTRLVVLGTAILIWDCFYAVHKSVPRLAHRHLTEQENAHTSSKHGVEGRTSQSHLMTAIMTSTRTSGTDSATAEQILCFANSLIEAFSVALNEMYAFDLNLQSAATVLVDMIPGLNAKVTSYIREPSGANIIADLDVTRLAQLLKEIINGPFDMIMWDSVIPGAHFMQLVGRSEFAPSIWLRGKLNTRGASAGSRKVLVNGKRVLKPLTKFVPAAALSLLEGDAAVIEAKFYTREAPAATPVPQPGTIDQATHEAIITNYLQICQLSSDFVESIPLNDNETDVTQLAVNQVNSRIWPLLRDAVIFEMSATSYVTLFEEFTCYIARCAKIMYDPLAPVSQLLDQLTPAAERRVVSAIQSGTAAPFPEKMPFKACFFAYGPGVNETTQLPRSAFLVGTDTGTLLGHLVCADGTVVSFRRSGVDTDVKIHCALEHNLIWTRPETLSPWIINALVDYVNEHKSLVEQGHHGAVSRTRVKQLTIKLNLQPTVPPPFYVVYMKDSYVRDAGTRQATLITRHIDWQHRWKVRGHDCIRFDRGPLPMDPDLTDRYTRLGYQIFTTSAPDAETFTDLLKRNVPPKAPDEWMVLKKFWRNSYEKGPEDKPLIESVRRTTKDLTFLPDDVN